MLRQKDEAFLVSFDVNIDLLQDYTNSPRSLAHAMDKAEINTAGGNGAAGVPGIGTGPVPVHGTPKGTLLYDAIYMASNQKMNQETGRKAMIILTDGDDQGSEHKISEAIAAAEKNNIIVYVILIADTGFYGGFGYSGYSAAKRISDETGGHLINVGNNGNKLEAAFQQIQDECAPNTWPATPPPIQNSMAHSAASASNAGMAQKLKCVKATSLRPRAIDPPELLDTRAS